MEQYVTCDQMKQLERMADESGLSYYQMMENAGTAATEIILQKLSEAGLAETAETDGAGRPAVWIFCGKGNNGGDGFVVARLLCSEGYDVTAILVDGEPKTEDAKTNRALLEDLPVKVADLAAWRNEAEKTGQARPAVIVDAIYGTGFKGQLKGNGLEAANIINEQAAQGTPVFALDIPSGLSGDMTAGDATTTAGAPADLDSRAVRAVCTITFHARKPIHLQDFAKEFCGEIITADIGISDAAGDKILEYKLKNLEEIIEGYGQMLVALSGGVDSVFLLAFGYKVFGDDRVAALTAESPMFAEDELQLASSICDSLGIAQKRLDVSHVLNMIKRNPPDRCYHCKREIFSVLKERADMVGSVLADGTNLDDMADYRPGYRAIREMNVASPLKEAGLTKQEIRKALKDLAEELGQPILDISEKPAFACLASRIPYGETVSEPKLAAIYEAEQFLKSKGFNQVRVRCHEIAGKVSGNEARFLARIEFAPEEMERLDATTPNLFASMGEIEKALKAFGFEYVTMDLGGYEKGKMNSILKDGGIQNPDRIKVTETVVRGNAGNMETADVMAEIDRFLQEAGEKDYSFKDFVDIIEKLRMPDGCPWDRAQTHESLKKHMVEEANEALDAIDEKDWQHLCEELGDVLLQIVLHAQIAREAREFTIDDVIQCVSEKMIRRHPHVFGNIDVSGVDEGLDLWEEIKKREKALRRK